MKKKVKPIERELKKLKAELFFGDYPIIMKKANKSGAKITRSMILNAFNGRLKNDNKLTSIRMATIALIAERAAAISADK
jgi:hypothetical protein